MATRRGKSSKRAAARPARRASARPRPRRRSPAAAARALLSERVLLDLIPDFAFTKDLAGRYVVASRTAAVAAGLTPEEMEGRTDDQLWDAEQAARFRGDDQAVLASGQPKRAVEQVRQKDGAQRWVEVVKVPVKDRSGRVVGLAGLARDVTEREEARERLERVVTERTGALEEANRKVRAEAEVRQRAEERIRQLQKLEAVGRLAGGVAHDFNNLLTIVKSCSEALLRDPAGDEAPELAREIADAARRGADLTRQLLTFSRRQSLEHRELDLNALVESTRPMLDRLIREDVAIRTELTPGLAQVRGDHSQLEQVLVNLVVNARDAMPRGGTVTVATALVGPDHPEVVAHAGGRGRYAVLAVRDDGVGMGAEIRSHLFEPFFTTKALGQGTGLGLATVFGIVQQSGGFVTVDSAPGEGSTFRVYLPLFDGPARPALTPPPAPPRPVRAHGQTLLLAEDDAAVRSLLRRFLEAEGYRVLEAPGPEEALQVAEGAGDIDGLVTDVVMPQMNGAELAEQLSASRPGMRVLFVSASTDPEQLRGGPLPRHHAFLPKPFDRQGLAHAVRALLER